MKRVYVLLVCVLLFSLLFAGPKDSKEPNVSLQLSLYLTQNFGLNFSLGVSVNYEISEGKEIKLPKPKKHPHDIVVKYPKGKRGIEVELELTSGLTFKAENVTVKKIGKNRYRFDLAKSSSISHLIILSGTDVFFAITALQNPSGNVMIAYWYRK
ncbi:hypothetical protein SAMN04488510_10487 [Fervidobacterium changbaicum]|uniref:Uncharacterized protein n=2 Tax=Fervidobacterium TaxID=2422 RepID=A0AAI8CLQ6_FERIS|nr:MULTISPECIES: hypothetical protein [Fervidobacterium]AMW33254.1 hypothetical protein NA23_08395 [Fervidobacterium islandicum]QAV33316.1 hypothetical protein CBS1_05985 [Fervidobacterium changbaicum]SDH08464.1 hypothetical protein SAMN04488510_10487 [Fervidobacterium changbaicum]